MDALKETRRLKRTDATKTCNLVTEKIGSWSIEDKIHYKTYLESVKSELDKLNEQIFNKLLESKSTEAKNDEEYKKCTEYTHKIIYAISVIQLSLQPSPPATETPSAAAAAAVPPAASPLNKLKLPQVKLPVYGHREGEDLNKFFNNFEQIIDKYGLSNYERFVYLQQQLSGEPLTVIKSLATNNQNYDSAKALLEKAFASKITLQFEAVERLSKLKFDTGENPYQFISDFRLIIESFRSLEINSDIVLQYFIWQGMNSTLKNQFVNITNKNRPSLAEIEQHIFDATERYKTFSKKPSSDRAKNITSDSTSACAAAVKYNKPSTSSPQNAKSNNVFCSLCSDKETKVVSHSTSKCPQYSSPQDKLDRLNYLGGCTRCSNVGHTKPQCKFRFRKRCSCSEFHFPFLCVAAKNEQKQNDNTENKSKTLTTGSIFVGNVDLDQFGEDAIIPTFSVKMNKNCTIRGMRDSGCQPNFISCDTAKKLKLKIVRNDFPLNINGFNSSEHVLTDIVELKLVKNQPPILAVCVPEIKTKLHLPNLRKMAMAFKEKGYILADKFLLSQKTDEISNLDFILGNNDCQLLHQQEILFGTAPFSMYTKTPFGVCLIGGIKRMGNNLQHLPQVNPDVQRNLRQSSGCTGVQATSGDVSSEKVESIGTQGNLRHSSGSSEALVGNQSSQSNIEDASTRSSSTVDEALSESRENLRHSSSSPTEAPSEDATSTEHINIPESHSTENESTENDKNLVVDTSLVTPSLCSMKVSIDRHGYVDSKVLDAAAREICNESRINNLQYDDGIYNDVTREQDQRVVDFVLDNTTRDSSGRLSMPLLWNPKVKHMLAKNERLSKCVLQSNLRKLEKNPEKLFLYDNVIKDQTKADVIERIHDLSLYLQDHPNASFLPHMGVFRMGHESTKCRVVMLSNLVENANSNLQPISHNQAMLSGPNLNRKISTAITKIRFDENILCFDFKKAFLSIKLDEIDKEKVLFHWFQNVQKNDFTIVGYKFNRLPFGLRCSPAILMLGLYKLLIIDTESDDDQRKEIKKVIYDLLYMDNGAITSNGSGMGPETITVLKSIFEPYHFLLQQFVTNDTKLQEMIDQDSHESTPTEVKLLGLRYNRKNDTLSTAPLKLDITASTKRMMLSSLASNYDVLQFTGPLLNRARLFIHKLQNSSDIGWDDLLSTSCLKEWKNISKQLNSYPPITIDRFVGRRDGNYSLIGFSDASKFMIGCVIYIQDNETGKVSFILAKNRIVNRQLVHKSIPSLELHAISFAVETLMDTLSELNDSSSVTPINITKLFLFADSMVALNWINSFVNKLNKMQKQSPFVMNRLDAIHRFCEKFPVNFKFVGGLENPSDLSTRPTSYKQFNSSCYLSGPEFLMSKKYLSGEDNMELSFIVPNPNAVITGHENEGIQSCSSTVNKTLESVAPEHIISLDKYSDLGKLVRVLSKVMKFINRLKIKCQRKNKENFSNLECYSNDTNFYTKALTKIIKIEQEKQYPECVKYLSLNRKCNKSMPNLVGQLNLFSDDEGILRVRSKFSSWNANSRKEYPILLPRTGILTEMIINSMHHRFSHAGIYSILGELRKRYFIPRIFSTVKKVLKLCLVCKRQNARTIKTNQSDYREFREKPPHVPYRYIFLDHFGPYWIKLTDHKTKVWVLCITCLWTRAINLVISYDMTTKEFLRTFQHHIYQYGLPERVFSDLGSQIVAGANLITNMLNDTESHAFFNERNMKVTKFQQYFKGNHELGSLVEICVKMSRRLISGSLGNKIPSHSEFSLIVAQANHLVNKRPIAFKETLRDSTTNMHDMPETITPENLLRGYDTHTLDVIPGDCPDESSEEWKLGNNLKELRNDHKKLSKIRSKLTDIYHNEFLGTLMRQATDKKDRYRPVKHDFLKPGHIVLLKEEHRKATHYPMAIVRETIPNDLGEVTNVIVKKGATNETVKRHVSSVIPFLSMEKEPDIKNKVTDASQDEKSNLRPARRAALISTEKTRKLLRDE